MKRWIAILAATLLLTVSSPARADFLDELADAFIFGVVVVAFAGALVITDIVFTAHDGAVVADDEQPTTGWAVGEALVTGPQALFIDGGMVALAVSDEDDPGVDALLYVPSIWLNTLAVHGAWSWAALDDSPDSDALYGVPWIIGANIPATMYLTARSITGRAASTPMGVAMMAATSPGVAVSTYHLAAGESAKPGWGALAGWSGGLFLYGTTSVIVNAVSDDDDSVSSVVKPPSFALMPTTIVDVKGERVPGLMAFGAF